MSEQLLSTIDPRLQKQVTNARRAVEKGNPSYAIPICVDILKRNPGLYEVRQVLREAQKKAAGAGSGMKRFFSKVTSAPFALGGAARAKKDPAKAMESAETILTDDPTNTTAHKLIGQAAEELGYHNTAVFAYNCIREIEPDNIENLKSLALALIEIGKTREAVVICDGILQKAPSDGDAQTIIRKASVAQSLDEGKWEDGNSFRDKLKDEKEAVQLEQASRAVTGDDALRELIKSSLARIESEPENMNVLRDLANNYHRLGDYENALIWVRKARSTDAGQADVAMEKFEQRLRIEQKESVVEERRSLLEEDPNNGELKQSLAKAEKDLEDFRYSQARELVEKYPNEYGYRFEYGQILFSRGEIDASIAQFQVSQRNPKVRVDSLFFLGKAFKAKKIYDLAIEQLTAANNDLKIMNELKKEIMYELAQCFEHKGDAERAIEEFKKLYSADIGYKDVAQKIDAFYSKSN